MGLGKLDEHSEYFKDPGRDTWIKSIITLGTPHKGTTITSVVEVGSSPSDIGNSI